VESEGLHEGRGYKQTPNTSAPSTLDREKLWDPNASRRPILLLPKTDKTKAETECKETKEVCSRPSNCRTPGQDCPRICMPLGYLHTPHDADRGCIRSLQMTSRLSRICQYRT